MDCRMPGFPVHHQLPKLAQTHVHQVSDAIQPSHPLSSPSPPAFNLSQHHSLFQWVSSLHQVAKIWKYKFFKRVLDCHGEWVRESHSGISDSLRPHGLYSPWPSPGQNTGVGSLSLVQGIFQTQGLNPGLQHCRRILYQLSHKGSPRIQEWVAYPFSRGSSWPRNRTGVSCIAGGFFTNWAIRDCHSKKSLYCFYPLVPRLVYFNSKEHIFMSQC